MSKCETGLEYIETGLELIAWCIMRGGVTAWFGVFLHEIKCNRMTSFMEFMHCMCIFWSLHITWFGILLSSYSRLLQGITGPLYLQIFYSQSLQFSVKLESKFLGPFTGNTIETLSFFEAPYKEPRSHEILMQVCLQKCSKQCCELITYWGRWPEKSVQSRLHLMALFVSFWWQTSFKITWDFENAL